MRVPSTVGLGLRLAVGGGRSGLVRLGLTAVGVAIGVALLLGGLGVPPALQSRHAREGARQPVMAGPSRHADYLIWSPSSDQIGDHDVSRITLAAVGKAPLPPGVDRLPGPGERVVSPALQPVLASALGRVAAPRYPGRVIGTVGPGGLIEPRELLAYVGADPAAIPPDLGGHVVEFGGDPYARHRPIPLQVKFLILVAVAGLLIPTLVFVATSTRLSAASRERRLAAIRLVGATPGQVRMLAAVESGLAAALGAVLGIGVFFVTRPVVAGLNLAGYRWFPSDIAPPVGEAILVLVAAPALAVGAALLSLRRLIVTPLGVTRRARVRGRSGVVRLLPLVAGLAGFGLCWLDRAAINRGGVGALVAVGTSFVLVLVGVGFVAPWLGAAVAPVATLGNRRLGSLLGARRLRADPSAAGRVVGAVGLLVFMAGVVHALVPADSSAGVDVSYSMRPTSALVEGGSGQMQSLDAALAGIRGAGPVVPIASVSSADTASGSGSEGVVASFSAWIADCSALRKVLVTALRSCGPGVGYVAAGSMSADSIRPGSVVPVLPDGEADGRPIPLRLPLRLVPADLAAGGWQLGTDVILPPEALPADAVRRLLAYQTVVGTDGRPETLERLRTAVEEVTPWARVSTLDQALARARFASHQITSLVDLGMLVALGIAMANLLVVTIDHVQERRRPVAVMAASGVPLGVLRRSVAIEIGIPLAAAIVVSAGAALVVSGIFGSLAAETVDLPLRELFVFSALASAAVGGVTALTLPALSRAARPETLQVE